MHSSCKHIVLSFFQFGIFKVFLKADFVFRLWSKWVTLFTPNVSVRGHSISAYAKHSEKLKLITPWYARVRKGKRNVSFLENSAHVLIGYPFLFVLAIKLCCSISKDFMDLWLKRCDILHKSNSVNWCKWNRTYNQNKKIAIVDKQPRKTETTCYFCVIFRFAISANSAVPAAKRVSLYIIHSNPNRAWKRYAETMKVTEYFCWPIV